MQDLISVVVPYYKHFDYMERCLESIMAQTYQNLELIVLDDCSPDGSGKLVEAMCANSKLLDRFNGRVYFESFEKNKRAHNTINYGVNKTKGDYIAIINCDDTFAPKRIEILAQAAKEQDSDFVFSKVSYIDGDDRDISEEHPLAQQFKRLQESGSHFPTIGFGMLAFNFTISTGNFFITRSLFDKIGGFRNLRYCHDWDFVINAVFHTEPVFIDVPLYNYRFHGGNSFESLQHVAITECEFLLKSYFSLIQRKKPTNKRAPCQHYWGEMFGVFLKARKGQKEYYDQACCFDVYVSGS